MNQQNNLIDIVEVLSRTVSLRNPDDVREQIKQLALQVGYNYLQLAGMLYAVKKNEWFYKWGYNSFQEYVEKELDFQVRKAYYLVKIWDWYVETLRDASLITKVAKLGWTKMAIMAGAINRQNADELLRLAEEKDAFALTQEIKKLKDGDKEKGVEVRKLFLLTPEEIDTLNEAIAVIKQTHPMISDSRALGYVALSFLSSATHNTEEKTLINMVKKWEKQGYKFFITKDGKTVYSSQGLNVEYEIT